MFGSSFPVFIWNTYTCVISFDDLAFNTFIQVSVDIDNLSW